MGDRIKPCPFCGSLKAGVSTLGHRYFVVCECGAEGPPVFGEFFGAIRRWNLREGEEDSDG